MTTQAIVSGSIGALAERNNTSLAESFLSADAICLVDTSGSMATPDSRGGRSRYEVACEELGQLQVKMPGKIAVVSFSGHAEFAPSGIPAFLRGNTDLAEGLRFVKPADGTVRLIVVSDGEPDDENEALGIAKTFTSRIDTIYVGPESDRRGADFLQRLAKASGGRYVVADKAQELAERIQTLLLTGR